MHRFIWSRGIIDRAYYSLISCTDIVIFQVITFYLFIGALKPSSECKMQKKSQKHIDTTKLFVNKQNTGDDKAMRKMPYVANYQQS